MCNENFVLCIMQKTLIIQTELVMIQGEEDSLVALLETL